MPDYKLKLRSVVVCLSTAFHILTPMIIQRANSVHGIDMQGLIKHAVIGQFACIWSMSDHACILVQTHPIGRAQLLYGYQGSNCVVVKSLYKHYYLLNHSQDFPTLQWLHSAYILYTCSIGCVQSDNAQVIFCHLSPHFEIVILDSRYG